MHAASCHVHSRFDPSNHLITIHLFQQPPGLSTVRTKSFPGGIKNSSYKAFRFQVVSKTFDINLKLFTWGLVFSMTSSPNPSCPVSPCPTVSTWPLPLDGQNSLLSKTVEFGFFENVQLNFVGNEKKQYLRLQYYGKKRSPGVPEGQNQGSVVDISFSLLRCLPV